MPAADTGNFVGLDGEDMICEKCRSENVFFSKKNKVYVCEDCGHTFMPKKESKRVFISYAHDRFSEIPLKVKYILEEKYKIDVWIDSSSIKSGDEWRQKITQGIKTSTTVVAFMSEKSVSEHGVCLDELQISVAYNKHIIPVQLEEVDMPSAINYRQYYSAEDKTPEEIAEYLNKRIFDEGDMTEQMASLKEMLDPEDFSAKLMLATTHFCVPRVNLTAKVEQWLKGEDKRVFWLHAKPGAGKSIFSAQLYLNKPVAEAVYFCEWDKMKDDAVKRIICSIAFQIALRNADYRELIIDTKFSDNTDNATLFEKLLVNPLSCTIDGNKSTRLILIDALDELETASAGEFLRLVYSNVKKFPRWLKFAFTCRPSEFFKSFSSAADTLSIDLDEQYSNDDIENYCRIRLEQSGMNETNARKTALRIATRSDGVFMYAEKVVDDIVAGVIEPNNDFPVGLNALFCSYFDRSVGSAEAFRKEYSPVIGIILAVHKNVSPSFIASVLDVTTERVSEILKNIRDYFVLLNENEQTIVKPYHKSITDWFYGMSADMPYYCDISAAKDRIIDYGLQCVEKKSLFDAYYTEYFYFDIKRSAIWLQTESKDRIRIYLHIIRSAIIVGNIDVEKQMLTVLERDSRNDPEERLQYLSVRLNFETRHRPLNVVATIDEMKSMAGQLDQPEKAIKLSMEIATGYFYCGENYEGMKVMEEAEKKYCDVIKKDKKIAAKMQHVYGLLSHDIDKNQKVVDSALYASREYRQSASDYDYMISLVNLYDGYMGVGQLEQAWDIIQIVDAHIVPDTSLQIKDIHHICKGNVCLSLGRPMTALYYYEKGLKIAKRIGHTWDYTYGRIWRCLALAYYGERDCIGDLAEIFFSLSGDEYLYLRSLAGTFYFIASYLLKVNRDDEQLQIFGQMKNTKFTGHKAIIYAAAQLIGLNTDLPDVSKTVNMFVRCEGIKGGFGIAADYYRLFACDNKKMQAWTEKYVDPVFASQQKEKEKIVSALDGKFRVKKFCCKDCCSMCCYDGVYVSKKEEENITSFIAENPTMFEGIPSVITEESAWENMISGRKTLTKHYKSKNPQYPAHFNDTMCIFARGDGACMLQKAATALELHPWKFKPMSCWMFPLDVGPDDKILPPPASLEEDPNYIPGKYDGYVSALPCGQFDPNGKLWTDVYYNEIEFYDHICGLRTEKQEADPK